MAQVAPMSRHADRPRYSAEDFETASVRSAAPSYVSEVPSYHSHNSGHESIPAYTPRTNPSSGPPNAGRNRSRTTSSNQIGAERQPIGLPPVPNAPRVSIPSLHNYRLPTWSANNALAARHYHNVAERRVTDGRYTADGGGRRSPERFGSLAAPGGGTSTGTGTGITTAQPELRPLEDPYLVGEVAAAKARQERLARETGDDILIREDRQWDWLLSQMKDWEERERSWKQYRRELENGFGPRLQRRVGRLRAGRFSLI